MNYVRIFQWSMTVVLTVVYLFLAKCQVDKDILLLAVGIPLLILTGIPHGATDHVLYQFRTNSRVANRVSVKFLSNYLTKILLYALLWYLIPSFALLFFLLISAYHFGETHIQIVEDKPVHWAWQYFLWGLVLLTTLFLFHLEDAIYLLNGIVNFQDSYSVLFYILLTLLVASFVSTIGIHLYQKNLKVLFTLMTEYAVMILVFGLTDLLFGFIIFFTLWHSVDAIQLQINLLSDRKQSFSIKAFITAALPFSVISIIGILSILYIFLQIDSTISLYTLFLILISLLTLPHQWEVSQFYRLRKSS